MQNNSMDALSKSLAQKQQQDQEQIQKLTLSQLKKLVQNLRDGLSGELNTTKTVTNEKIQEMTSLLDNLETSVSKASATTRANLKKDLVAIQRASSENKTAALDTLKWGWLKYSLPALLVLVTILGGSWGAMHLMSQELMETRQQILSAQQTLQKLPGEVQFLERSGNQYLLLETEPEIYQVESGSWVVKLNKR